MTTQTSDWNPPKNIKDLYEATDGNQFSGINRPTAGARVTKALDQGDCPVQLYSLATPNGQKVSILFEELIESGCQFAYDAFLINIGEGEQFTSGFTELNPNGRIPTCLDRNEGNPIRLFESGSIALYFAEKYNRFIPSDPGRKAEMMNWVFWQMGSQGPMSGQFGHFFVYAPGSKHETREYGTARYGMEAQRLCDVLDQALAGKDYLLGDEFSLADIMAFPWFHQLQTSYNHASGINAAEFLSVSQYENAGRWSRNLLQRPGFQRGLQVCSWTQKDKGTKPWLTEK
ncbi:MAG: glutathione S-transferase C-terminal domain-containing protein [Pseudobacteriovorax sp.]|nr:glutathione S-transferase C-terminal domain-containing protein [Pseudobacteriovorax sp.]